MDLLVETVKLKLIKFCSQIGRCFNTKVKKIISTCKRYICSKFHDDCYSQTDVPIIYLLIIKQVLASPGHYYSCFFLCQAFLIFIFIFPFLFSMGKWTTTRLNKGVNDTRCNLQIIKLMVRLGLEPGKFRTTHARKRRLPN